MNEFFNSDAEVAVLSIIINNPNSINDVKSLKPFMFDSTVNTLIFATMIELKDQSYLPDFTLVYSRLEAYGKLKNAGGIDYLNYIRNNTFNKENLNEFVSQVINHYKSRVMMSKSSELKSRIEKGEPIDEVIHDLRSSLDNLSEISGGEQVLDFSSVSQAMWDDLVKRVQNPGIRGITTGYKGLDEITGGYCSGDLWVLGGRPGMGKSTDLCNSALAVAESGRVPLIFSLEMNKISVAERLISLKSGIPLADIRLGTLSQGQLDTVSDTIKQIKNLPIQLDTNYNTDEDYFISTTRKYKALRDVSVVFFDYVQLAAKRGENQTAEIGVFSRAAKLLANDLGITVVMYSQLNRGVELREDKRPVLSDLRQSGNLEEDADIVMFLYRDEYYYKDKSPFPGQVEKIISKFRNGPTGTLFYSFDSATLKLTENRSLH